MDIGIDTVKVGGIEYNPTGAGQYFIPPLVPRFVKSPGIFYEEDRLGLYWISIPITTAEQYWKKVCSSCKQEKHFGQFYRSDAAKENLARWGKVCKDCKKTDRKERYKADVRIPEKTLFAVKSEPESPYLDQVSEKNQCRVYSEPNLLTIPQKQADVVSVETQSHGESSLNTEEFAQIVKVFSILKKWRDDKKTAKGTVSNPF